MGCCITNILKNLYRIDFTHFARIRQTPDKWLSYVPFCFSNFRCYVAAATNQTSNSPISFTVVLTPFQVNIYKKISSFSFVHKMLKCHFLEEKVVFFRFISDCTLQIKRREVLL